MVPADDTTYLKVPPQKIGGDLKHLFVFTILIILILLSEDVAKGGRSYKDNYVVRIAVVVVDVVVVAVVSLWW